MKFALVFLIFGATTAQSDSFCGVTDEAAVLDALQGHWVRAGATSIESVSISEVSPVSWPAEFGRTGEVDAWEVTTAFAISDVVLGFDGPIYDVDGIIHYCVANMPGGVARTATFPLNNATMPFTLALANKGYQQALSDDPNLRNGLNIHRGKVTIEAVAQALGYDYVEATAALNGRT